MTDLSVLEAVRTCLTQKGKSISEIENEHNRKYEGSKMQHTHRNEPVWHNKRDLDNFVVQYLKIDTAHASRMRIKTTKAISMLRSNKTIEDWNTNRRFGLWRLSSNADTTRDFVVDCGKKRCGKIQAVQDSAASKHTTINQRYQTRIKYLGF